MFNVLATISMVCFMRSGSTALRPSRRTRSVTMCVLDYELEAGALQFLVDQGLTLLDRGD